MDTDIDFNNEDLYEITDEQGDIMTTILNELDENSYDVRSVNANPLFNRPDLDDTYHDDDDIIDDILQEEIEINKEFKDKNEKEKINLEKNYLNINH